MLLVSGLFNGVELSFTLFFLHGGTIYSQTRCSAWIVVNFSLIQLSIFLMAWTSIERYLFIHHNQLIRRHLIALHYGPIVAVSLYCPLFYTVFVVLYRCETAYDVRMYICGGPCYSTVPAIGFFDWLGNGLCIETVIVIVNVMVITRHLVQRHRMKRMIVTANARRQWVGELSAFELIRLYVRLLQRRSGKLVAQLLSVAMLCIVAWYPYCIIVLIQVFHSSEQLAMVLSTYFVYAPYLQSLLMPYICILFMPEVKKKIFPMLAWFKQDEATVSRNRVGTTLDGGNTVTRRF